MYNTPVACHCKMKGIVTNRMLVPLAPIPPMECDFDNRNFWKKKFNFDFDFISFNHVK